jgi:hypothetical protein
MAFISEFTNEIYDQSTAAFNEENDSTRVFLGVLVTLLPKIIPRIMPAIMGGDARIQEKFQDAEYITQVEQMFREKFLENLGVFENLIVAWQDNSLAPEDLGLHDLDPNHILAREDLIADSVCCKHIEVMVHDELVNNIGQNAGTYRINDQVNNYTSWVSDNGMRAIWHINEWNQWAIGDIQNIGSKIRGIRSETDAECPCFCGEVEEAKWDYSNESIWNFGGSKIQVKCIGEPASFQSELLAGIHFLKDRMQRSIAREDDSINRVANTIWTTAITIADLISAYFNF